LINSIKTTFYEKNNFYRIRIALFLQQHRTSQIENGFSG
jgi:hypothetical protein